MSLPDLRDNQAWRQLAACSTMDTTLFYAERAEGQTTWYTTEVWAACKRCPVRKACLDYAVDNREEFGIWGGTTPTERRQMWRANAICAACDTHFDRVVGGQRYCDPCRTSRSA